MVFFVATVYIYCSFSRMLAYAGRCVLDYVKLYIAPERLYPPPRNFQYFCGVAGFRVLSR